MSKSSISVTRIRLLLHREWVEQGRLIALVLLGLTMILIAAMVWSQSTHWEQITRNNSYVREELAFEQFFTYVNSFFVWLIPAMTIMVSLAFGAFRRREDARWLLSLPASQQEKWLSKGLVYLLFLPLLMSLIYLLVANVHLAILSTPAYAVRWVAPGDLSGTYPQPFLLVSTALLGFFFLMAIWQPRFSWLKGLVTVLLLGFLMTGIYRFTVEGISGLSLGYNPELGLPAEIWELTGPERARVYGLTITGFILFGLSSLLTSYFALREKQA